MFSFWIDLCMCVSVCVWTTQTQSVTDRGNVICNEIASPNRQNQQECMMLISLLTQRRWGTGKCFWDQKTRIPWDFLYNWQGQDPHCRVFKAFVFLYPPPSPLPGESEHPGVQCQKHLIPPWGTGLWKDPPQTFLTFVPTPSREPRPRTWVCDLTQMTQLLRNYFLTLGEN